jgi:O-antigen/teichoic acid export membrane protein
MHLSRLASNALFWAGLSALGSVLLQAIQLSFLAHSLTPADFGLAAMMSVVMGLATTYGDAGLSNAILTHQSLSRRTLSSLYWIGLGVGLMLCISVALIAPLVATFFSEPRLVPLIRWAGLGLAIAPLGLQFQLLFQKELEFRALVTIELSSAVLGVAVAIGWALQGGGVFSIVLGGLVTTTIKAVGLLTIGLPRWPLNGELSLREARPLLGFGAYQLGERTLAFLARNLDKTLIGWLLGAYPLGLYNTAYQLMQKPLQVIQPLSDRIATPLLSRISGEPQRLVAAYLLIVELSATLLFPAMALLVILAEPIVELLLGAHWHGIEPTLRWLALLGCFYAAGFPIGILLLASRRADISFWLNVWRLLPVSLAIAIGSRWGASGIAFALVVAQGAGMFTVGFVLRSRVFAITAKQYLTALAAPTLLSVASATVAALSLPIFHGALQHLVAGIALFSCLYVTSYIALRRNFIARISDHLGLHKNLIRGENTAP